MAAPATNVVTDPKQTLATYTLEDLAPYTREGAFPADADPRFRLFFVGRDDVHGILKHIISRSSHSLKFNQFGYDDDELDGIIRTLVGDPNVYVQGTLDRSQAGGVHEKKILAGWDQTAFAQSFAIGQSATHQISHTKGGVCDALVGWEGQIVASDGSDVGRKSQNNTLMVWTDREMCGRFSTELDIEHATARVQEAARAAKAA